MGLGRGRGISISVPNPQLHMYYTQGHTQGKRKEEKHPSLCVFKIESAPK